MARRKLNKVQVSLIILIAVVLIGVICACVHIHYSYLLYTTTNSPSVVRSIQSRDANSNQLEYNYIFHWGCKRCDSIQHPATALISHDIHRGKHVIVLDQAGQAMNRFLSAHGVDKDPTIVIKYRGSVLYQYSGTNMHIVSDLMDGINPKTNHHFHKTV